MDNARDADDEYTTQSTTYCPEAGHGNGMFSSSHHFTVTAQSLANITKNYTNAPSVPSDVRIFALGDIDLQCEIRVDAHTGIARLEHERRCVRRLYSARIADRRSKMTAVLYQGNGAEEEWRQDVAKYMTVHHPNIIQIAGVATSGGIHAALFTDDLIPFNEFLALQQFSHFSLVYFYVCYSWDYDSLDQYFNSTFKGRPGGDCTKWIRRSTGRFCAELDDSPSGWTVHTILTGLERSALIRSNPEIAVIDSLTIRDYHEICARGLSLWRPLISHLAPTMEITVGAVLSGCSGHPLEDPVEIAVLANPKGHLRRWDVSQGDTQIMGNGWTRGYNQSGDYLRALFTESMDGNDTSSCSEHTHESSTIDCGSDQTEASNFQNSHRDHDYEVATFDPTVGKRNFRSHLFEEGASAKCKVLFNIQLILILFLGVSWLYEQM